MVKPEFQAPYKHYKKNLCAWRTGDQAVCIDAKGPQRTNRLLWKHLRTLRLHRLPPPPMSFYPITIMVLAKKKGRDVLVALQFPPGMY